LGKSRGGKGGKRKTWVFFWPGISAKGGKEDTDTTGIIPTGLERGEKNKNRKKEWTKKKRNQTFGRVTRISLREKKGKRSLYSARGNDLTKKKKGVVQNLYPVVRERGKGKEKKTENTRPAHKTPGLRRKEACSTSAQKRAGYLFWSEGEKKKKKSQFSRAPERGGKKKSKRPRLTSAVALPQSFSQKGRRGGKTARCNQAPD